ncbi:type VI secretion system-associated FHA domain protein TagH [Inquilinus sp. NPDC058860]|uniref:type VI secretion system-associated FHA domain protein TagH n=1 Tax=Inquilinus sp. NPDC058860 TaxID=3346652 RepID=UPI003673E0FA
MKLTIDLVNAGPGHTGHRESRTLEGRGLTIGRSADNDWVVDDPSRTLSKNHCLIDYVDDRYVLFDLSANGTFVNNTDEPVGRSNSVVLSDGDRIWIGDCEFAVRLSGTEAPAAGHSIDVDDPAAAPFGIDPDRDPPASLKISNPEDWPADADADPFADGPDRAGPAAEPDHLPTERSAFRPPPIRFEAIPEDWDEQAPATPDDRARPPPKPPPAEEHATRDPPDAPEPPPAERPTAEPAHIEPAATPAAAPMDLIKVVLEAAGLDPAQFPPERAEALARTIGSIFRATAQGLIESLDARTTLKTEFRIERTAIRPRDNNPLKFSATAEEALMAILSPPLPAFAGGAEAIEEAFRDIRNHELATIGGMEAALGHLIESLAPQAVEAAANGTTSGLGAVLPAARKAKLWDAYVARHRQVSETASENIRDLFGRAFAEGYERRREQG